MPLHQPAPSEMVLVPADFNSREAPGLGLGSSLGLSYSSFIYVCHLNLNNLLNKIRYLENMLNENNIDIVGVSETWLVPSTPDSFVQIEGYRFIRSKNVTNIKKHEVGMYIRNHIKF